VADFKLEHDESGLPQIRPMAADDPDQQALAIEDAPVQQPLGIDAVRKVGYIDSKPLVHVITELRDYGRAVRAEDEELSADRVLALAAKAHAALMWFERDIAGDLEAARRWIDEVWA